MKYNVLAAMHNDPQITSLQQALLDNNPIDNIRTHVYPHQPWDKMWTFLIWYLWVDRCNVQYSSQEFNSQGILIYTWTSTLHIGMALWSHMKTSITNPQKLVCISHAFTMAWTPLFYSSNIEVCHFTKPPLFNRPHLFFYWTGPLGPSPCLRGSLHGELDPTLEMQMPNLEVEWIPHLAFRCTPDLQTNNLFFY